MFQDMLIKYLYHIARRRSRDRCLPILIYHRVLSNADNFRPSEPTIEQFKKQMQFIKNNFEVLTITDAVTQLERGELSDRAISITFDDGYKDNYENAAMVLNGLSLPATFFIATGFVNNGRMWNDTVIDSIRLTNELTADLSDFDIGEISLVDRNERPKIAKKIIHSIKYLPLNDRVILSRRLATNLHVDLPNNYMMNESDINSLHSMGMEIGAHTVNHPILLNEDYDSVKKELFDSKQYLEALIDQQITSFAYPNGRFDVDYDESISTLVKEAGYCCAVSTDAGVNYSADDIYKLKRFTPWNKSVLKYAIRLMQSAYR